RLVGRARGQWGRRRGACKVNTQALADREFGRESIERGAEVAGLARRAGATQDGQVVPHLAIPDVDGLVQLLELARDARRVALQEQLAGFDAEIDARQRLDEAVVQVARDARP